MESIQTVQSQLKKLITSYEHELSNFNFQAFDNSSDSTLYGIKKVQEILTSTKVKLHELIKMIDDGEKKEYIINYIDDICGNKRNEIIIISQLLHQGQDNTASSFIANIVVFFNEIETLLSNYREEIVVIYDRYFENKHSKKQNFQWLLEKLYFPIVTAIIIAVATLFINNKLTNIEDTQKREDALRHVSQKYKINKNMQMILNNTANQINEYSFAIDNLEGLLKIVEKSDQGNLTTEEFESFKISMGAMQTSLASSASNIAKIHETYAELLEEAEVYDIYYKKEIVVDVKESFGLYEQLNRKFIDGIQPTFNSLYLDFINATKQGNLLNIDGQKGVNTIRLGIKGMRDSIDEMKVIHESISKHVNVINQKIDQS
ncbi:hypothetical protein [Sulfuricurvum sp.]|uniref:hypothetical protein n=1 Tax=Sulfuricurvum sp. TaxID=2025608 RepID=UPI0026221003|nr:hypothetical protein [Sulfuricurvum sp.]MDD2781957.1 hypothetical protein [Sulfuricurvum sp.]